MSDAPAPGGGGDREPFRVYRERLAAVGFHPSSTRGQNFLLDPTLHRWIADNAAPTPADTVVEIGVGLGFLTRELAPRCGRLLGVELEPRLLSIARDEVHGGHIDWVEGDALGGPGRTLLPAIEAAGREAAGRFLVVANLPYSVSGPLLAELAQAVRLPDRVVVLVQKELGQRLAAAAGSPDYGGLSVLCQALFRVRSLRDVAPEVFRPRPKVVSAVVALERRDDAALALGAAPARRQFATFVRALFAQRRKALRRTLPAAWAAVGRAPGPVRPEAGTASALPEGLGDRRAESLSPDDVVSLWQHGASSE